MKTTDDVVPGDRVEWPSKLLPETGQIVTVDYGHSTTIKREDGQIVSYPAEAEALNKIRLIL